MPNDQLTPARLRALIAAARRERDSWCSRCDQPDNPASIQLRECMDESASSLADALEIAQNMQAEFPLLLEECRRYWKSPEGVEFLRAAKEASE